MTKIVLNLDIRPGMDMLTALMNAGDDLAPVHIEMGGFMVRSTKQRFVDGEAPDGSKWAPNTPLTLSRKKGTQPGIGESRSLSQQIHWQADSGGLEIGSTMEYAATFHFGALMGAFGRYSQVTKRIGARRKVKETKGYPIPWGNIPARPILGASQADEAELLAILTEHFKRASE